MAGPRPFFANVAGPWSLIATASATILALLIGISVVPPSRQELRDAAVALVPPEARLTGRSENTGSELVSGQYFASVRFAADGMSSDELDALAVDNAIRNGWEVTRIDEFPYGRETWLRRGTLVAELHISLEQVEGEFHVREDRSATFGQLVGLVVICPLAVLTAVAFVSFVRARARKG